MINSRDKKLLIFVLAVLVILPFGYKGVSELYAKINGFQNYATLREASAIGIKEPDVYARYGKITEELNVDTEFARTYASTRTNSEIRKAIDRALEFDEHVGLSHETIIELLGSYSDTRVALISALIASYEEMVNEKEEEKFNLGLISAPYAENKLISENTKKTEELYNAANENLKNYIVELSTERPEILNAAYVTAQKLRATLEPTPTAQEAANLSLLHYRHKASDGKKDTLIKGLQKLSLSEKDLSALFLWSNDLGNTEEKEYMAPIVEEKEYMEPIAAAKNIQLEHRLTASLDLPDKDLSDLRNWFSKFHTSGNLTFAEFLKWSEEQGIEAANLTKLTSMWSGKFETDRLRNKAGDDNLNNYIQSEYKLIAKQERLKDLSIKGAYPGGPEPAHCFRSGNYAVKVYSGGPTIRYDYKCIMDDYKDEVWVTFAGDLKTVVRAERTQYLGSSDANPRQLLEAAIDNYGEPDFVDLANWLVIYGDAHRYDSSDELRYSDNASGAGLVIKGESCGNPAYGSASCSYKPGATPSEYRVTYTIVDQEMYADAKQAGRERLEESRREKAQDTEF